nr:hypothetical protein [Tanacetum cinerariifolium]
QPGQRGPGGAARQPYQPVCQPRCGRRPARLPRGAATAILPQSLVFADAGPVVWPHGAEGGAQLLGADLPGGGGPPLGRRGLAVQRPLLGLWHGIDPGRGLPLRCLAARAAGAAAAGGQRGAS